jgi:hypothetical protein
MAPQYVLVLNVPLLIVFSENLGLANCGDLRKRGW